MRAKNAEKCQLSRDEAVQYLVEILKTPIGEVTADHRLAQSYDAKLEILNQEGFGEPHVRWAESEETSAVVADLAEQTVAIEVDGEVVEKYPILHETNVTDDAHESARAMVAGRTR